MPLSHLLYIFYFDEHIDIAIQGRVFFSNDIAGASLLIGYQVLICAGLVEYSESLILRRSDAVIESQNNTVNSLKKSADK